MPHFLAARPRAVAQRGRMIASLVGVLAFLVAMLGMTTTAGASTSTARAHASGHHAGKHEPGDKKDAQNAKDDEKAKADEKANHDRQAEDVHNPQPCDSSGPGNPCHPPQACGQNSGHGNGDALCPPVVNQGCPVDNQGQGNAEAHHDVPENVGNLNWGGPDWNWLFSPATTSIYRITCKVSGNRLPYMR